MKFERVEKRSFPAVRESIPEICQWICSRMSLWGCGEENRDKIELASEEIVTNIVSYAYPEFEGSMTVECGYDAPAKSVYVLFEDQGIPFNPLDRELPPMELPFDERPVGGLGIYLVMQSVDRIEYWRHENRNHLKILKEVHHG